MDRIRFSGPAALALAIAALAPVPAFAQAEIVAQSNPDADQLAAQVRVLAESPRNIDALISAGDLSTRLGDTAAALSFFARAEAVDPNNPRIFAGRGRVLVRLERPGEALRLFALAEQRGVPSIEFAADRGLAYDLLGQPTMAQRDYRAALSRSRDDETVRRLALSLGITNHPEEAMAELDSLLRRRDRASWRARAFVLAMSGDVTGAERIAASMMPGTMGQAMTPFFRRLPTLSAADRAFAVHFGELRPTQARLADAQLSPALPAYVPEPRPAAVAAVTPAPAPAPAARNDRRSRRDRQREPQVAAAAPVPVPAPSAPPLPPPPNYEPVRVATVQPTPIPTPTSLPAEPSRGAPIQLASRTIAPRREIVQPTPAPAPAPTPAPAPAPAPTQAPEPVREEVRAASVPPPSAVAGPGFTRAEREPAPTAAAPPPEPVVRREVAAAPTPSPVVGREDSTLSAIISGITIPASELGVVPMPGERAAPPPAAEPEPAPVRVAAAAPPAAIKPKPAAAKPAAEPAKPKKKPEPAKPDPKKLEPSRIWVQVAGGANEQTLAAAWKKLTAKAPAAFKGRTPWTTPLRATNRVLAGPFKTSGEAQGFVNQLAKADISAFVFTSEAGQKIARLAVK